MRHTTNVAKPRDTSDNRTNRKLVTGWVRNHARDYDNSTQLAEACADELDLYEDKVQYTIPPYIFEISGEAKPST